MLDSNALPVLATENLSDIQIRSKLRKVALLHVNTYNILPSTLSLQDVRLSNITPSGAGSFSNVYRGTHGQCAVALKQLKVYMSTPEDQKQEMIKVIAHLSPARARFLRIFLQMFHREAMLWKGLLHDHIVPFLGVSEDAIRGSPCMVLPWYESGSLRDHLPSMHTKNARADVGAAATLSRWVSWNFLRSDYVAWLTVSVVHSYCVRSRVPAWRGDHSRRPSRRQYPH